MLLGGSMMPGSRPKSRKARKHSTMFHVEQRVPTALKGGRALLNGGADSHFRVSRETRSRVPTTYQSVPRPTQRQFQINAFEMEKVRNKKNIDLFHPTLPLAQKNQFFPVARVTNQNLASAKSSSVRSHRMSSQRSRAELGRQSSEPARANDSVIFDARGSHFAGAQRRSSGPSSRVHNRLIHSKARTTSHYENASIVLRETGVTHILINRRCTLRSDLYHRPLKLNVVNAQYSQALGTFLKPSTIPNRNFRARCFDLSTVIMPRRKTKLHERIEHCKDQAIPTRPSFAKKIPDCRRLAHRLNS